MQGTEVRSKLLPPGSLPAIREIARHERLPASATGKRSTHRDHQPGPDLRRKQELLGQRSGVEQLPLFFNSGMETFRIAEVIEPCSFVQTDRIYD
jgi:hypothetical protein